MISNAGDLNRKISIQRIVIAQDSEGARLETRQTVCSCWAAVKDETLREFEEANRSNTEHMISFIIRYRTDVLEGMSILLGGTSHEILEVNKGRYAKDYLLLKARRRAAIA